MAKQPPEKPEKPKPQKQLETSVDAPAEVTVNPLELRIKALEDKLAEREKFIIERVGIWRGMILVGGISVTILGGWLGYTSFDSIANKVESNAIEDIEEKLKVSLPKQIKEVVDNNVVGKFALEVDMAHKKIKAAEDDATKSLQSIRDTKSELARQSFITKEENTKLLNAVAVELQTKLNSLESKQFSLKDVIKTDFAEAGSTVSAPSGTVADWDIFLFDPLVGQETNNRATLLYSKLKAEPKSSGTEWTLLKQQRSINDATPTPQEMHVSNGTLQYLLIRRVK